MLITSPTASNLRRVLTNTAGLIESIYGSNSDGLGIMFPSNDVVPVALRTLPKSDKEALAWLLANLPDDERPVAMHARFTTHGDTNLDNCHPYEVDGGYLMHNGVLASGQGQDKTKSDTWWYCRWFLDGGAHNILGTQAGRQLVGSHIGSSNKFAFLDKAGQIHVINKDSGVEYEGLWFSNTYAWDVSTLDPTYKRYSGYSFGRSGDPRKAASYGKYSGKPYSGVLSAEELEGWDLGDPVGEEEAILDMTAVLNSWMDDNDSVSWLMYAQEDLFVDALNECGVHLLDELFYEMGEAYADDRMLDMEDSDDTDFTRAIRAIEKGDAASYTLLQELIDDGKAETVVHALIYGVTFAFPATPKDDEDAYAEVELEDAPA